MHIIHTCVYIYIYITHNYVYTLELYMYYNIERSYNQENGENSRQLVSPWHTNGLGPLNYHNPVGMCPKLWASILK